MIRSTAEFIDAPNTKNLRLNEAVVRRVVEFTADLKPTCPSGRALVERAGLLSVRLDRCMIHQEAVTAARVELAVAEFDRSRPQGPDPDPEKTALARARVADLALFDPSPEAARAHRYEAATEREFYRALREFKALQAAKATEVATRSAPARPDPTPQVLPHPTEAERLASFRGTTQPPADFQSEPAMPATVAPAAPPKSTIRTTEAPARPHLNRRQRRAALARGA